MEQHKLYLRRFRAWNDERPSRFGVYDRELVRGLGGVDESSVLTAIGADRRLGLSIAQADTRQVAIVETLDHAHSVSA